MKTFKITFLAEYTDEANGCSVNKGEIWFIMAENYDEAEGEVYRRLPELWTPLGPQISFMCGER